MSNIRYYNQAGPFWDFVANLEGTDWNNHPFVRQWTDWVADDTARSTNHKNDENNVNSEHTTAVPAEAGEEGANKNKSGDESDSTVSDAAGYLNIPDKDLPQGFDMYNHHGGRDGRGGRRGRGRGRGGFGGKPHHPWNHDGGEWGGFDMRHHHHRHPRRNEGPSFIPMPPGHGPPMPHPPPPFTGFHMPPPPAGPFGSGFGIPPQDVPAPFSFPAGPVPPPAHRGGQRHRSPRPRSRSPGRRAAHRSPSHSRSRSRSGSRSGSQDRAQSRQGRRHGPRHSARQGARHGSRSRSGSPSSSEDGPGPQRREHRHGHHHGPPHGHKRGGHGGRGGRGGHRRGGRHGGPFGGPFDMSGLADFFQDQVFGKNNARFASGTDHIPANSPTGDFVPPADVFDTESSFIVDVAVPGAQKADIAVHWDAEKSELVITGVTHRTGDEEFLKTIALDERKVGAFERKVRLGSRATPAMVDADGITAKLDDGVLRVKVPKEEKEFEVVHKVEVN